MENPQAGWYPDPSGDTSRYRWWDGTQWTENYTPAQQSAQPAQPAQAAPQPIQPNGQVQPQAFPPVQQAQPGQNPTVTVNLNQQQPMPSVEPGVTYAMSDSDRTLRLAAFVLNILGTVALCWLILPLAWCIPMTVHSWGIYKGTKANTVAFGVCDLIFCSLIGGILLLVSKKDK